MQDIEVNNDFISVSVSSIYHSVCAVHNNCI